MGAPFVEHLVGDPRLISLIRRWLKAGILEDGEVHPNEEGTPQGGSISVMLSNVYFSRVEPGPKRMENAAARVGHGESAIRDHIRGQVQVGVTKPAFTRKS